MPIIFLFSCRACPIMFQWKGLRRFYNWAITRNLKKILLSHSKQLKHLEANSSAIDINWNGILSATCLQDLDEALLR